MTYNTSKILYRFIPKSKLIVPPMVPATKYYISQLHEPENI